MANVLPGIMRYFRACYQADLRAAHLLNFLSNKVSLPYVFADEAFIDGTLETHPLPSDLGENLAKHLHLHAKEQQLYCFAFFLTGKAKILGKYRPVCAPLYMIPAELLEEDGLYQLSLDFSGILVNPAFSEVQINSLEEGESVYELLNQQLPHGSIGFDELQSIEQVLKATFPALEVESVNDFPQRITTEDLRQKAKDTTREFSFISAMGMGVMDKATGSLGILNELEELSREARFSPILNYLFTNNNTPSPGEGEEITPLPVTLSDNQEEILKSSAKQTLTLVNGPPGTGKSFTIAAIAADRLSKGETVLIVTKNPQALEVIADKLEHDLRLPQIAVRASRKDYRKHLRKRLKDWLYGLGLKRISKQQVLHKYFELKRLSREIDRTIEITNTRAQFEQLYGQKLTTTDQSWWHQFQKWLIGRKLNGILPIWELFCQLDDQLKLQQQVAKEHLEMLFYRRLRKAFLAHRADLQSMLEALKSKTGNQKQRYFQQVNFKNILPALPIWLVDTSHVHQVLPLKKGLFDLVIIDEAGQADIASCLPILQRAKRAVIVGDPKQLRHVSFLSRQRQRDFLSKELTSFEPARLLSYRDNSILDISADRVQHQDQVFLLDEHYRSLPDIIQFSNEQFYRSELKIMTSTPTSKREQGLQLVNLEGKRNSKGQNPIEATAILSALQELMEKESHLDKSLCQSVGILSPFRAQVDYFKRIIKTSFSNGQIERHRLLVGTAHDFQGEERDLMYISWVVGPDTPKGVYTYLNKEDVFNVSITRARNRQYLYLSVPTEDLPANSLLAAYTSSIVGSSRIAFNQKENVAIKKDQFLAEIKDYLTLIGVKEILVDFPLVGANIDLVVVHENETYCIDLVGYPGAFGEALSLDCWKSLSRVNVKSIALAYSHWYLDQEDCKAVLAGFLRINTEKTFV